MGINYTNILFVYLFILKSILIKSTNNNNYLVYFRGSEIYLEQLIAQKDDVVLVSSDGLFDNMEDHEIEEVFQKVSYKLNFN